jgi:hypothetical protein
MNAEIDFTFTASKGCAWKNTNQPQIQITISSDGHVGIWANDGGDGLTVCWCDVSVADLKAIVAACDILKIEDTRP